jgi:hypothetical protein
MSGDTLDRKRIERIVEAMPALVGASDGKSSEQIADETSWRDLLRDYFRVMEIAHYVRRGGVKAMIYRVETGRVQLHPSDYFDEANATLLTHFRSIYIPPQSEQPVLERLAAVSEEEEEAVRDLLPEIDSILLSEKRKEAALSEEQQ